MSARIKPWQERGPHFEAWEEKESMEAEIAELRATLPIAAELGTYPPCKGMNCGCTDGVSHSAECQAEHAASVAGGYFVKLGARVKLPCAEVEDGRMYIPLPGGWEVQTKGKGSTFRICHVRSEKADDYERWIVTDERLHEPLEAMALAMRVAQSVVDASTFREAMGAVKAAHHQGRAAGLEACIDRIDKAVVYLGTKGERDVKEFYLACLRTLAAQKGPDHEN